MNKPLTARQVDALRLLADNANQGIPGGSNTARGLIARGLIAEDGFFYRVTDEGRAYLAAL